jgi:Leucine-rich repeat (LRR) protein
MGCILTQAATVFAKQRELSLAGRDLTALPKWVREFRGLKKLDLSDNQLTALPTYISDFRHLEKMDLTGNPLPSIPVEIKQRLDRSLKPLMVYLRNLKMYRIHSFPPLHAHPRTISPPLTRNDVLGRKRRSGPA